MPHAVPVPTRSTRATASCRRTRTWPRRVPRAGITFVGPTAVGAGADRQQGPRDRRGPRRRRCRCWARPSRRDDLDELLAGGEEHRRSRCSSRRSPAAADAGCAGSRTRPTCAASVAGRDAGGRICLRRPDGVPRAGGGRAASHRGADPGRRRGQRHPPLRAGLLGAAPPPEGGRAGARRRTWTRRCASGSAPTPSRSPEQIGYINAGTVEFLRRRAGPARVHRDEPADPGGAHGHRGGHRRRPGAGAAADRGGGDPGRPGPGAGDDPAARRGAAVPDHHRGPGQRLPPGHRPDHHLPLTRRRGHPAGRRHRARRAPRSARTSTRCWSS